MSVVSARHERLQPRLLVHGEVVAGREAEIRSMVAGRITAINPVFRSGASVRADDELAVIDPFNYEIAIRERRADLDEAAAKLRELEADIAAERELLSVLEEQIGLRERDRDRVRNLASKNQTSEKALDDAELALNDARQRFLQGRQSVATLVARIDQQRAAVERSRALLERAERDFSYTTITAPFDGYLQDILVATGKRVDVGESLGRLIAADGLEVRFELPNADYARLVGEVDATAASTRHPLIDTAIEVTWRLGRHHYGFDARIERTGAEVDSTSGGIMLFARIVGGPIDILRPGAFVEVALPDLVYDDVIALPETAVADGGIVYIVEDDRLVAREIRVVHEFGGRVLVRGEIADDTKVVAEQFPAIGPGMRVRPM